MSYIPETVTVVEADGYETTCYRHNVENTLALYQSTWCWPDPPGTNATRWCYLVVQTLEIDGTSQRIEIRLEEDLATGHRRAAEGEMYIRKWGFDPGHGEGRMRTIPVRDLTDAELLFWLHAIQVRD